MKETLRNELARICAAGATYADIRWYPEERRESLYMLQGNLKSSSRTHTTGIGVRVLCDGAWGFAATSDTRTVRDTCAQALENARAAAKQVTWPVQLADAPISDATYASPCDLRPTEVTVEEKITLLRRIDEQLTASCVAQRMTGINVVERQSVFLSSEGTQCEKRITDVFAHMGVIGVDEEGQSQERSYDLMNNGLGTRGWEFLSSAEAFESHASRIVDELGLLLSAPTCPQDTRSVILLPGIMFLQTHEVIGHALELDRILGYELSYAGGSFVRLEDFGALQYGSEKLTVRADGTVPNSPGSYGYDDDGVACKNTVLIDKGVLVNAITSRQTITEANARAGRTIFTESGACARASNYDRVPIERMSNINVDAGSDGTLDDIVAATSRGIIMDGARSWSIGSNREQFHFACEIGWLVEDGAVTGVVKNPTYGMDTLPFWRSLSAVGSEETRKLVFVPNCGKGQPNQAMFVGHQVPVCRFDNVPVGR